MVLIGHASRGKGKSEINAILMADLVLADSVGNTLRSSHDEVQEHPFVVVSACTKVVIKLSQSSCCVPGTGDMIRNFRIVRSSLEVLWRSIPVSRSEKSHQKTGHHLGYVAVTMVMSGDLEWIVDLSDTTSRNTVHFVALVGFPRIPLAAQRIIKVIYECSMLDLNVDSI